MPGYASHILQQYYSEMGVKLPEDALVQYQHALLEQWMSHLQHVLRNRLERGEVMGSEQDMEAILREFLYGAMPHPQDALERNRLVKIVNDQLMHDTRIRFGDGPAPGVPPHVHRNDHTHPAP